MSQMIELSSDEDLDINGINESPIINEANDGTEEIEDMECEVEDIEGTNNTNNRKKGLTRKKTSFTIKEKLSAFKWYKKNGRNTTKTATQYKTCRQNIIRWVQSEDNLLKLKGNKSVVIENRSRDIKLRKPKIPELEKRLIEWFIDQRRAKLSVTQNTIVNKALQIFSEIKEPNQCFSASNGWLNRFLSRNRLTFRTATTVGQKIPNNAKELCLMFFDKIDVFRAQNQDFRPIIANMDEMAVYFETPMRRTYESVGSQTVSVKTTGNEKIRLTVMLCADSEGRKCKPTLIFRGLKKVPKDKFPNDVHIMVNKSGSVDSELLEKWRKEVFTKRPGGLYLNIHSKRSSGPKCRTLLVIDSAKPHLNSQFKKLMAKNNDTNVLILPAGMTPILQPADLSWNHSVKTHIKTQWSEWMAQPKGPQELNYKGNVKSPSYGLIAEWVSNAWKLLPKEQIINSFKLCNMGSSREDSCVHSKLLELILNDFVDYTSGDHSGITDDESEEEEVEEVIDLLQEIDLSDN